MREVLGSDCTLSDMRLGLILRACGGDVGQGSDHRAIRLHHCLHHCMQQPIEERGKGSMYRCIDV